MGPPVHHRADPRPDRRAHGVLGPRATSRSLVVGFGNTATRGEASSADAPRAAERADLCEIRTTDAPTAGEHVDPREASATESAPDPPCGRERRPPAVR